MEKLTGQKVWLIKVKLGENWGIIGVFDNPRSAEKYAEKKYREWNDNQEFTWNQGKTAQEVHLDNPSQKQSLDGQIVIREYIVRSK